MPQRLLIISESNDKRVIPAKAGIQKALRPPQGTPWIPAFAGMTQVAYYFTIAGRRLTPQ